MMSSNKFDRRNVMTRREFGMITAMAAAAVALPFRSSHAALQLPGPGPEAKVILEGISKGSSENALASAVRRAAEAATDFSWLSRGDAVFIKPAVNSGNNYPATTSPTGLKAMAELLKEKGAGRVVVCDMSGVEYVKLSQKGLRGSTRKLMKGNGLAQAAEAGGAELYLPEEQGWGAFFEDGPQSGSHWKAGIMIPSILKEMDHVVLLPRTGRHALAGTSLGMKAAVGYMRTDSRLEYHRDAGTFFEKTAEINTVPSLKNKLRLTLTVADKVLTTFGPDNGYVSEPDTGLVFASESLVAHDMVSLAWLLINRDLTPESEKRVARDPYPRISAVVGRGAVMLLGGVRQAAKTEKINARKITSVWDEPTLHRAYHLWGGVPRVKLVDPAGSVPEKIKKDLADRTAIPA
jgi:uncharacterized protein (DUF362 family)